MTNLKKESAGIISAILEYQQKQRLEAEAHVQEQKLVMDADTFLNEEHGIMNVNEFMDYVMSQTESELLGFKQFLTDISHNHKLTIPFLPKTDKAGKKYLWITVNTKTANRGYKLIWTDEIDKLVSAFQYEVFNFELDLDTLFEKAVKVQKAA